MEASFCVRYRAGLRRGYEKTKELLMRAEMVEHVLPSEAMHPARRQRFFASLGMTASNISHSWE